MGLSKQQPSRCDRVPDTPGAEMQHDTSPYCIRLGDTPTKLIASLLYLRYSKRRYLKFFRVFKMEEHTSELQSQSNLVCRLLLEKKKKKTYRILLYIPSD